MPNSAIKYKISDMNPDKSRYAIPLSIILAGLIVSAGILITDIGGNWSNVRSLVTSKKPAPAIAENPDLDQDGELQRGKPGSGHTHANLIVYINNNPVDMGQDAYMLKSDIVHFENSDGLTVHTHATGISVPYFLATLGFEMTQNCLALDTGEQFCSEEGKRVSMVVNGTEIRSFKSYEIKQGDQILVNYGNDVENGLLLKFNNIPPVPKELL